LPDALLCVALLPAAALLVQHTQEHIQVQWQQMCKHVIAETVACMRGQLRVLVCASRACGTRRLFAAVDANARPLVVLALPLALLDKVDRGNGMERVVNMWLMLNLLDFDRRSTSACSVVPAADAHATCLPSHSLRTCLHAFCDSCLAAAPVYSLVYSPFTAGLAI